MTRQPGFDHDSPPAIPATPPLSTLWREPIPAEKRAVLEERWNELPEELRVGWQVVGRQMAHCGYTLGPAYCSFGCTHCYLPRNANKAPLPSLGEMKAQLDANRRQLGPSNGVQITGGDVIDAYVRAGRPEELVEVVRYAQEIGLVPMVMTHGQKLLDDPGLLERLVTQGGLRKLAVHIDVTQAGRPGFPIREIETEEDLHPLREQFVDLILGVRETTGVDFHAAHTMTITSRNLSGVGEVIRWMAAEPRRLDAFRMLSLQPEADVGRTRFSQGRPATPEAVWQEVAAATGRPGLSKDNLWFGHPDCSHMSTLVALYPEGRMVEITTGDEEARKFYTSMLARFGGVGFRGPNMREALLRRIVLLLQNPGFFVETYRYFRHLMGTQQVSLWDLARRLPGKRWGVLNIVQHNFMSQEEVRQRTEVVEKRLAACSFRGAVQGDDGSWEAVPMCAMNVEEREQLYDAQIAAAG